MNINFQVLPEIQSMGLHIFEPIWSERDHIGNNDEIVHIKNGNLDLIIGDKHYPAKPGDTLLVPHGTLHRDDFDLNTGLETFMIFFKWEHTEKYCSYVDNAKINQISNETRYETGKIFDSMRSDQGTSELDRIVANSRLLTILTLIYRDLKRKDETPESSDDSSLNKRQWLMREAKKYIETHYSELIRLEDIAEELSVSPFYLSRVFSLESDFSLFSFLTEVRMNRAKELLQEGRYLVSDVAYKVGYENSGYFSKVFKKYFGYSPSNHRFD